MRIIRQNEAAIWQPRMCIPAAETTDVWLFSIRDAALSDALARFLSPEETRRLDRLPSDANRRRFSIGHGALRRILAAMLGCPEDALCFAAGEHGKPYLLSPSETAAVTSRPPVFFNLSHSGDYIALALSACSPVGVDIQDYRTRLPLSRLSARVLHPREAAHFAALSEAARPDFFFSRWALKEALVKGVGCGITLPLPSLMLCEDPDRRGVFTAHAEHIEKNPACLTENKASCQTKSQEDFSSWQLMLLPCPDRYALALAYRTAHMP